MKRMKNKILIVLAFLSLCNCRNYESEKYITIENEAINDIILQLIDYERIKTSERLDTNYHFKLLLFLPLTTTILGDRMASNNQINK
jgi:hypothetical protein